MDDQPDQVTKGASKYKLYFIMAIIIIFAICLVAFKIISADRHKNLDKGPIATLQPTESPEIADPVSKVKEGAWKTYKNDVIGMEFQYQENWGEPRTLPVENITKLAGVINEYKNNEDNSYANGIELQFKGSNNPMVKIFNDQYEGQHLGNSNAYQYGYTDNISEIKRSGNICDYKIAFDHRPQWKDTLQEIYGGCSDGVKISLTKYEQHFNDVLYTYNLNLYAYKKLQNGYFDNALISFRIGSVNQTKDALLDLDGFFKATGLKNDYEINKKIFTAYVQSLNSYIPPSPVPKIFQTKEGENPDITVIRNFYFYLETGRLDEAYDMGRATTAGHNQFVEWYGDTYSAVPYEFIERSPHQYRFFVDYQDSNKAPEKYRVEVQISGGKIIPVSSEKMLSDIVVFGDMSAFSMQKNGRNYTVFSRGGVEAIIDEAEDFSENMKSVENLGVFLDPKFSPFGKYLTYQVTGWEWAATKIYDIENDIVKTKTFSPYAFGFTENERYFYDCEANAFGGELYGRVFELPDFNVKYELPFVSDESVAGIDLNCEYDKDKKVVRFIIANSETKKDRIVEYSIVTNKEEVR